MSRVDFSYQLSREDGFQLQAEATLPEGSVTGIYGPSGSGKTTLLYCLAGLLRGSDTDQLSLGGETLQALSRFTPTHQRDIAMVFQDSRLFPHLDVAGNLAFAAKRRRREGPGLEEVTDWLGLGDLLQKPVTGLSRGQQQRVAIGRALLAAPRLLLLDEPLANIDPAGRRDILERLTMLKHTLGMTMVYVSHDMAELSQLADWLMVLSHGQITAQGPLLELSADIELSLAHEEQAAAILDVEVAAQDERYGLTELQLAGQPLYVAALDRPLKSLMRVRLPARDVSLCRSRPTDSSILNVLEARVDSIEAGERAQVLVRLAVGEQYLLARVTRKSLDALALVEGEPIFAQVKSVALLSDARVNGSE